MPLPSGNVSYHQWPIIGKPTKKREPRERGGRRKREEEEEGERSKRK